MRRGTKISYVIFGDDEIVVKNNGDAIFRHLQNSHSFFYFPVQGSRLTTLLLFFRNAENKITKTIPPPPGRKQKHPAKNKHISIFGMQEKKKSAATKQKILEKERIKRNERGGQSKRFLERAMGIRNY